MSDHNFKLEDYFKGTMDKAVSNALKTWDEYVAAYPDQSINKAFLVHNVGLIHRILEAVVPEVLADNAELEEECDILADEVFSAGQRHLQTLVSVSSHLRVHVSLIKTVEDMDRVRNKLLAHGPVRDYDEQSDEVTGKLLNVFWLFCATLPNDSLSPHLVDHAGYTALMRTCKNVETVSVDESPLFASSDAVDDLLNELGME
jgi:hypothetical protein